MITLPDNSNIEVRKECAGIGDWVYVNKDPFVNSNYSTKIIKGSTCSGADIDGYKPFGVIYGFEGEMAMILAKVETSRPWMLYDNTSGTLSTGKIPTSSEMSTWMTTNMSSWRDGWSTSVGGSSRSTWVQNSATYTPLTANFSSYGRSRNGLVVYYHAMNVVKIESLLEEYKDNSSCPDAKDHASVHPTSAYWNNTSGPMRRVSFEYGTFINSDDTKIANAATARTLYATYEQYVRQTSPIGNGDGSVFDKAHHKGKEITAELTNKTASLGGETYWFPAARYCYNYIPVSTYEIGHWWLPDMWELRLMMKDETYKILCTTKGGFSIPYSWSSQWSSVRSSSSYTWIFNGSGMSNASAFSYALSARAVTRLKLI